MPTAVTTTTMAGSSPALTLKAAPSSSSAPRSTADSTADSTLATLRSLYPRAAKAFLERNVPLTHSLLDAAFTLLAPPPTAAADALAGHRRKWDILRITFETTLYAAPPPHAPEALRAQLLLSPEAFLAAAHARALRLFAPASQKPSAAHLPAQILVTLVLSALKLECPDVARGMVEDWLARRRAEEGDEGYAKVMELYCLHVLTRLEDWDYAEEFLLYERALPAETRKYLLTSLQTLRSHSLAARAPVPAPPSAHSSSTPSRAPSPALSTASSSTASSTSTRTVTPRAPRPGKGKLALTPAMPDGASSSSIASAATSRTVTPEGARRARSQTRATKANGTSHPTANPLAQNGHATAAPSAARPSASSWRTPSITSSRSDSHALVPVSSSSSPASSSASSVHTTLALARHYLSALARSKLSAFLLFCIALPVLSFLLHRRRARASTGGVGNGGGKSLGAADAVRRRLGAAEKEGVVGVLWREVWRALGDTVRMGGRGLV